MLIGAGAPEPGPSARREAHGNLVKVGKDGPFMYYVPRRTEPDRPEPIPVPEVDDDQGIMEQPIYGTPHIANTARIYSNTPQMSPLRRRQYHRPCRLPSLFHGRRIGSTVRHPSLLVCQPNRRPGKLEKILNHDPLDPNEDSEPEEEYGTLLLPCNPSFSSHAYSRAPAIHH